MLQLAFLGDPDFTTWLHDWLPIIFMGLLSAAVFALMRFMPRTRPREAQAGRRAADRLGRHRGG